MNTTPSLIYIYGIVIVCLRFPLLYSSSVKSLNFLRVTFDPLTELAVAAAFTAAEIVLRCEFVILNPLPPLINR